MASGQGQGGAARQAAVVVVTGGASGIGRAVVGCPPPNASPCRRPVPQGQQHNALFTQQHTCTTLHMQCSPL
jgi:hypothetical protein